jgi:hypothetical protein
MAKKKTSRQPNIPLQALERARVELLQENPSLAAATPAVAETVQPAKKPAAHVVSSIKKTMTREELAQEYGYVLADLQSMAILALLLFIAMVVVALSLNSLL